MRYFNRTKVLFFPPSEFNHRFTDYLKNDSFKLQRRLSKINNKTNFALGYSEIIVNLRIMFVCQGSLSFYFEND